MQFNNQTKESIDQDQIKSARSVRRGGERESRRALGLSGSSKLQGGDTAIQSSEQADQDTVHSEEVNDGRKRQYGAPQLQ